MFPLGLNEIKSHNTFPKHTVFTLVPQFFKGHFRFCFGLAVLVVELKVHFMNIVNLLKETQKSCFFVQCFCASVKSVFLTNKIAWFPSQKTGALKSSNFRRGCT